MLTDRTFEKGVFNIELHVFISVSYINGHYNLKRSRSESGGVYFFSEILL